MIPLGVRTIFARCVMTDVGAQFIAPAWGAMPLPGRNELRPYIHPSSSYKLVSVKRRSCKNPTHTRSLYLSLGHIRAIVGCGNTSVILTMRKNKLDIWLLLRDCGE